MDDERRKEFDDSLDDLLHFEERKAEAKRKRLEQIKAMQENL